MKIKFSRILKIIFLSEFVKGLYLAFIYMFKRRATVNYPFEKDQSVQDLEVSMLCEDTLMVKRDVSLVNYARQFVRLKQSRLKLNLEKMDLEEQHVTTLIC